MIGSMPGRDRFECQTAIDSDAILQLQRFLTYCNCKVIYYVYRIKR